MASDRVEVAEEVARRRLAFVGGQLLQPCDWNSSTTDSGQFVVQLGCSPEEADVCFVSIVVMLGVIGSRLVGEDKAAVERERMLWRKDFMLKALEIWGDCTIR